MPVSRIIAAGDPGGVDLAMGGASNQRQYRLHSISETTVARAVVQENPQPSYHGDYTVTYNVSDRAGNSAAQITRTVTVTPDDTTGGGGGGSLAYWTLVIWLISLIAINVYRRRQGFSRSRAE